jgi:hypothetical protein
MNDIKKELKIKNVFEYSNIEYNKLLFNIINKEFTNIDNIFNKEHIIEILKIYKISKENTKLKEFINVFFKIFKIMSIDYIDQYEFYLIIFSFFKLLKNKNILLNEIKKINVININLNLFYLDLENYINNLSLKSNLIKTMINLNNENTTLTKIEYMFFCFSKDNYFYFDFEKIYDIFIDSISINDFNLNFILTNKNICKKHYNETKKQINELYGLTEFCKYENDKKISNKYIKILINASKII